MKDKKKLILTITLIVTMLIITLGITYATFVYRENTNNQQLVLGEIYMYYNEINQLNIENALPGDDYTNYFEFTINGKNTYNQKDIYYEVVLTKGSAPDGKIEANRLSDESLLFKLVEVNGEEETILLEDKTYNDLTSQTLYVATINKGTTTEVNKKYRLYAKIADNITICGGEITEGCDYFTSGETLNWSDAFASIKVSVKGDLNEKFMPASDANSFKALAIAKNSSVCPTYLEEDGITYISGSQDCIDFNYVWYSGKLWRITAIYPDGTMKMITDGVITSIAYGEYGDNKFYTNENTTSYMYQWLNQEFLPTLYNYENIIVENAVWNASPSDETISSKLPIEGQDEVLVNASVGLLNSYEHYKSYQNASSYGSGYLNIGYMWWLLNPYSASSSNVWHVTNYGYGARYSPYNASGVRPSIYLKSGVLLKGGTGTESNPYRIVGDQEEAEANVTLIKTRQSGEYVNFDEELYRIVGIENETTKIIKDDYVKDESSTILTKPFASSATFGMDTNDQTDSYWDYYLNKIWKPAIEDDYEKMLVEGTYYIEDFTGGNYKGTACSTISNKTSIKDCDKTGVSTWTGYVGLPRYGEMFASQTRNYTFIKAKEMWLITPYDSSYEESSVWIMYNDGACSFSNPSYTKGGRPTINLKSEILIESGSGTKQDPFVVGLPT